jgi:Flp pilus assembly pilin Flp
VRRVIPRLVRWVRQDDGLTSVEHAVILAVILLGVVGAAYFLSIGVGEPTAKIASTAPTHTEWTPTDTAPATPAPEVVVPPTPDASDPLWPWALASIAVTFASAVVYVVCQRLAELLAFRRTRRKLRDALSEEEVEAALEQIAHGTAAGPVVRLKNDDTWLIGRGGSILDLFQKSDGDTLPQDAKVQGEPLPYLEIKAPAELTELASAEDSAPPSPDESVAP